MASLRQTREALLLSHAIEVIDEEEFYYVTESTSSGSDFNMLIYYGFKQHGSIIAVPRVGTKINK